MDDVDSPSPKRSQITVLESSSNVELIGLFVGQIRAMVMLSLSTGMRRGEVCGLKWDKVKGQTLLVHR